jgi:hypothetical protein
MAGNGGTGSQGANVRRESLADEPQPHIGLLIVLLIHVSHEVDRWAPSGDVLLEMALRGLAMRLNTRYHAAGAPYDDDEEGFRAWLYERWPAPPTA